MNEDQQEIITDFTNALVDLDTVMEPVTEEQLDWIARDGGWSIRQVLHHLSEDGNVYTFIIERALATPGCKVFFGGFPGNEAWADSLGYDQRPIASAWDLLHAQNQFIAELVSRFPDRWDNPAGFYNEAGEMLTEMTVEKMISMLTDHMREHTAMIKTILTAH